MFKKPKTKTKILSIEDENDEDRLLAEMYKEAWRLQGFEVERAERKSFEEVKEGKPDFILLILLNPYQTKMDKIELLKALKENPETKEIPNLVLSNYRQYELKEIELKADKFLTITDFLVTHLGKMIQNKL